MDTTPKGPRRFGPYLILDRIGDGGMAEIFAAKMQGYGGFEKAVALKKILPRFSENANFANMLIHEAKLAARIQHFNVVQVLDLGEIDRQVYIAMEFVRGKDLAALLSNTYKRKEKMPVELSLFIATEFLTGLDYAHRLQAEDGRPLGLIHRDISPQNILISYEGEVKVTDFGIARVIAAKDGFQLPGNLHGKFGYMSPEQVLGKQLDQRSDIFSAGVVLHEMLTGQRLFRGKTPQATVEMILKDAVPPPSSMNDAVPPDVERICMKALARSREERYQTIGALLGELSRAADSLAKRAARRDLAVYMRRQFGGLAQRSARGPGAGPSPAAVSAYSPTAGNRTPIGEILVAQGSLSLADLEIGLAEQRARGGRLGEILLETGVIAETDLVHALARQSGVPTITQEALMQREPLPELLQRFPREVAESTRILPIGLTADQTKVEVVVEDPFDQRALLEARVVLGAGALTTYLGPRSAIRELIERWYPAVSASPGAVSSEFRPVLIADGDPALSEELAERVRDEEYEVLVATDGKEARELCRTRDPAVVFLDAFLPKIDGYNVLLDLRSRDSDAAVFVTSARADDFHQAKALELGADDFLVKPISVEVTASKIRREMQKRKQGKRAIAPPSSFSGVSGSLLEMTLIDIVQSLEIGRKSAHVVIQYEDGRTGELAVNRGETTACVAGARTGESAFYSLARSGPGVFRIEYRASTLPKNLNSPNTFLILETLRRLDEEGLVDGAPRGGLPPPQTQPPPTPDLVAMPGLAAAAPPPRPTIVQMDAASARVEAPRRAPAPTAAPSRSTIPAVRDPSATRPPAHAPVAPPIPAKRAMHPAPVATPTWSSQTPTPPPLPLEALEPITESAAVAAPRAAAPRKDSDAGWWDATLFPDGTPRPPPGAKVAPPAARPAPAAAPDSTRGLVDPITGKPLARMPLQRVVADLEDGPSELPTKLGAPPRGFTPRSK